MKRRSKRIAVVVEQRCGDLQTTIARLALRQLPLATRDAVFISLNKYRWSSRRTRTQRTRGGNYGEPDARAGNRKTSIRDTDFKRAHQKITTRRLLAHAADVEEVDQISERGKLRTAVADLQRPTHNPQQRQTTEVMAHAARRLRLRLRVRDLERRPFDLARQGACRYQPVIAGPISAGQKRHLNSRFDIDRHIRCRGKTVLVGARRLIPAAKFQPGNQVRERAERRLESNLARRGLDLVDLHERARFRFQGRLFVNQLHPLIVAKTQVLISTGVLHSLNVIGNADDRRLHRSVISRPFERDWTTGAGERAAVLD